MTYMDEAFLSSPFEPKPFFVGGITDPDVAEAIYQGTIKNIDDEFPAARIQRIDYTHEGVRYRGEVGKPDQRGEGVVMVIAGPSKRRGMYYVATFDRGVKRGDAIFVGGGEVTRVYEFLDS